MNMREKGNKVRKNPKNIAKVESIWMERGEIERGVWLMLRLTAFKLMNNNDTIHFKQ